MTRQELLKKRYAVVKNWTGDSELASRAKKWSNERIYNELGCRIPKKKTVALKPKPTSKQLAYKQRRLRKYQYGREVGLDIKDAKRLTRYKKSKIKATKSYKDQLKLTPEYYDKRLNREKRMALWKDWSMDEALPPWIHEQAREINNNTVIKRGRRSYTLDETDKYGYMIAYYMFVLGYSESRVRELNPVDKFDGNLYKDVLAEAL